MEKENYDVDGMKKEVVLDMINKIEKMRDIRKQYLADRKLAKMKLERKYRLKVDHVEKDIYNFENSIKKLCGSKEFYRLRAKFNREQLQRKAKDLNRLTEPNNINNTNNNL